MSAVRLLGGLVVIVAVGGAIAWQQGILKFGPNGVSVDTQKADAEMGPYAKAKADYAALRYQEAYDGFVAALKQLPNDVDAPAARFCLARSLEELHRKDEAIAAYKDFLDKYPNDERAAQAKDRMDKLVLMK